MKDINDNLIALTKGEESVMQILWSLGNGLVYDIIEQMPDPKPKYSTIATFIKMLENKGYVRHSEEGRFYRYHPTVDRDVYARKALSNMLNLYFEGSLANLVEFYNAQEQPDKDDMKALADKIIALIE